MKATSEDQRGLEAVKEHLPDLLSDLSRQRRIRDVTHEEQRLPTTPATPATAAIPPTPASKRRVTAEEEQGQIHQGVEEEPRQSRRRLEPGVQARAEELEGRSAGTGAGTPRDIATGGELRIPHTPDDIRTLLPPSGFDETVRERSTAGDEAESYGPERNRLSENVRSEAYIATPRPIVWRTEEVVTDHPSGLPVKCGADEVDLHQLTERQFRLFAQAKQKEVDSIITENQALRPLTIAESQKMLEQFPQRVVRSRFHYRMKPKDTEQGIEYVPKVVWVMLGFEDPDIH
eukprot:6481481-Amphidinium_carterae.3